METYFLFAHVLLNTCYSWHRSFFIRKCEWNTFTVKPCLFLYSHFIITTNNSTSNSSDVFGHIDCFTLASNNMLVQWNFKDGVWPHHVFIHFLWSQCPQFLLLWVRLHPSPPSPYLLNLETSCLGPPRGRNPANSSMWSPLRRRRWWRPTAQTKRELAADLQETGQKGTSLHLENMLVSLYLYLYINIHASFDI